SLPGGPRQASHRAGLPPARDLPRSFLARAGEGLPAQLGPGATPSRGAGRRPWALADLRGRAGGAGRRGGADLPAPRRRPRLAPGEAPPAAVAASPRWLPWGRRACP